MRKFSRVVQRDKLKFSIRGGDFRAVEPENFPRFLAGPVMSGMCSFKDIHILALDDFSDMNELMMVRCENETRAQKAANKKQGK